MVSAVKLMLAKPSRGLRRVRVAPPPGVGTWGDHDEIKRRGFLTEIRRDCCVNREKVHSQARSQRLKQRERR
jgi:hypothetical protein